jgi:Domain of unknown function (DUF1842)
MKSMTTKLIGAYLVKGMIGDINRPGSPIVHFALVVVPSTHKVSGNVIITQATGNGPITVEVTGKIYATGFGEITQVVSLSGQFVHCVPPPALGCYLEKFDVCMAINNDWIGKGGFSYGEVHIENVPVVKELE